MMNKLPILAAVCIAATVSFAVENGNYDSLTRQTGGYVAKPDSAKGKVVFLNAQKIVPAKDFDPAIRRISDAAHPDYVVVDVAEVKLLNPKADIAKQGGKVGIVLADSPELPTLVTAPESGWAIVNVAALKSDAKDPAVIAHRVRLEILRAFALAAGCSFMSMDPIALRPGVTIPEDLDAMKTEDYGVMARRSIATSLPYFGVTPWRVTTYRQACQEGWAHSPTNKYQERIWKRTHELPKKPMKIEFDPKKGE